MKILLICTANICRSPVAKIFLERQLNNFEVQIHSAGNFAPFGSRVDPIVEKIMTKMGHHNISKHLSKPLREVDILDHQLILCMQKEHILNILQLNPTAAGKIFLLGHWSDKSEVDDPTNGTIQEYSDSITLINLYCYQWAKKIIELLPSL